MQKKILIIRNKKSVGDTILATTLCDSLKKQSPQNIVHFLVYENLSSLFEKHRSIDEVITFDRKKGIRGYVSILKKIRKEKYDAVIDFRSSGITMCLTLFSGAKIKIGKQKKYRRLVYTHTSSAFFANINQIEKYHSFLKPLGIEDVSTNYQITLGDEERDDWKEKMSTMGINFSKTIIAMAVTARQPQKKYPEEYMIEVIQGICINYDCQIIFFYTPSEEQDIKAIHQKLNYPKNIFTHIETKNLRELACLFANSHYFIGNEGGSRHLAEAVGLKNLCIVAPDTDKHTWIINENKNNQCIDIKDINGTEYGDINPAYVLERIKNFIS